jgi:hypothetical protein
MIINKKRINSIESNIGRIKSGSKFIIGIKAIERYRNVLINMGFSEQLEIGETLLPKPSGPVGKYNALGKYLVHKDQPMETAYRTRIWRWKQWAGRGKTKNMSKIVEVPYKRYPRTFIEPPSIEFTISANIKGEKVITTPVFGSGGFRFSFFFFPLFDIISLF